MKIAILTVAVLVSVASLLAAQGVPPRTTEPAPSKQHEAMKSAEMPLRLFRLSNVVRYEDEMGHGEGDVLYVYIKGSASTGWLQELEGSQHDPPGTCLTGSFRNGVLILESHPKFPAETKITIHGKLFFGRSGYFFRGQIRGGMWGSPAPVTLKQKYKEPIPGESDPSASLSDEPCVCEWDKYLEEKSFVKTQCGAAEKSASPDQ